MTTTATTTENNITLTNLEIEVFKTIQYSDFFEQEDPTGLIWTLDCNDFADGLFKSKKALGAVMASLSKKNLIVCYPDGRDSTCGYTKLGIETMLKMDLVQESYKASFMEYLESKNEL